MNATIDLAIERPESKEIGELVRGYYTMMRVLGFDLGLTAHAKLSPTLGSHWFLHFIADRKQRNPKQYPPKQQFDYRDPALVLKDFAFEHDSPYRQAFGYSDEMAVAAKKIIWARNTWFHFADDPSLDDLIEVAQFVRVFAHGASLASLGQVVALLNRLHRIKTGRHQAPRTAGAPNPSTATPVSAEDSHGAVPPAAPPAEVSVPDDLPRPRIGGVWTGPIPEGRYRVTRTGDIVHPDTLQSLRERVGDTFDTRVKQWLAVRPRGDELWIAHDGAIGGWINEHPRLLGYIGDEPDDGAPRGFLLPHLYETRSGAVADVDSGDSLATGIADGVEPGTLLRLTTYGDVVVVDDTQGEVRVATVTADEWFPGHLP